jgi:hypothetical protein
MFKPNPALSERIQIRGFDLSITVATECSAKIVGNNEQNIRALITLGQK